MAKNCYPFGIKSVVTSPGQRLIPSGGGLNLRVGKNMKQHITKEQWDEINLDTQGKIIQSVNISADGMTIGQMIEFLGDDLRSIDNRPRIDGVMNQDWYIRLVDTEFDGYKELVNALWEAVKHKLKQ